VGNVLSMHDGGISFSFDANGNVTGVSNRAKDSHYSYSYYDSDNTNWFSESAAGSDDKGDGYVQNTYSLDKSGRTITWVTNDYSGSEAKSFTYTYLYDSDGLEAAVSASGGGKGGARDTYDQNRQLTGVDLGKGDGLDRDE